MATGSRIERSKTGEPVEVLHFASAGATRGRVNREAQAALVRITEERRLRESAPYGEWCRDPKLCAGKGYCPRDPTCGD